MVNIGNKGWGIVLGWLLWVIVKDLLTEILKITCVSNRGESYSINRNGLSPENHTGKNRYVSFY